MIHASVKLGSEVRPRKLLPLAVTLIMLCVVEVGSATAQSGNATKLPTSPAGQVRGRLAELQTGRAVVAGAITVRRASDKAFAGGALPRADGTFQVDGLSPGQYVVEVRALGYTPFARGEVTVSTDRPVADLGVLTLTPIVTRIEGQTVIAQRLDVALGVDRNSYSVKNMATASGGTAIDALRNVPAVDVDASNRVRLNGNSNVVVQINGRSSPLTGEQLGGFLAQLPAGTIARIEVATNPSAKSDPEGTAGIINIVLDQGAELGLTGGFVLGGGSSGASASGNLGYQAGPWTVMGSYSAAREHRSLWGTTELENQIASVPAFESSQLDAATLQRNQGLTIRSEYKATERDAISIDAIVSAGRFGRANQTLFTDFDAAHAVIGAFQQLNTPESRFLLQDYAAAYHRSGTAGAADVLIELRYSRYSRTEDNLVSVSTVGLAGLGGSVLSRTEQDAANTGVPTWSLRSDYARLISARVKLEAGAKVTDRDTRNDFTAAYLDEASGSYTSAPERASALGYREQIGTAYGVLSETVGKVDAQGGLRVEEASTQLRLPGTDQDNGRTYGSAFPSAALVYHVSDVQQAKISYSRRITRPAAVQLSPATYQDQPRSLFHGNPDLRPEYTDVFELGLQDTRAWGAVQLTPFVRRTAHAVRYIRSVDSSGVTSATFDNVASTMYAGANLNVNYNVDRLALSGGGGAYRFTSDPGSLDSRLSVNAMIWSVRANATWNFTRTTDGQLAANYLAPTTVEGGRQAAYVMLNLAARHKLWHDEGSVTLRLTDPFNLMTYGVHVQDQGRSQEIRQNFGLRGVYLSISRNFGQQIKLRARQDDDSRPAGRPVEP